MPAEYEEFANATCTQAQGSTILTFVRGISATGANQRALTPGVAQRVIYSHGDDGATSLGYHGINRDGTSLDFGRSDALEFTTTIAATTSPSGTTPTTSSAAPPAKRGTAS